MRLGSGLGRILPDYAPTIYEDGAEPVSDPTWSPTPSRWPRLISSAVRGDPFFDGREIRLRALQAASIQQIDKLIAAQAPPNAEMIQAAANLQLQKAQVDIAAHMADLRNKELDIRHLNEQGELAIRRGKDKATEIKELSQAMLNLANARKADAEAMCGGTGSPLRHQIDLLNVTTNGGPNGEGNGSGGEVVQTRRPALWIYRLGTSVCGNATRSPSRCWTGWRTTVTPSCARPCAPSWPATWTG
jgi:chaperonin GroES